MKSESAGRSVKASSKAKVSVNVRASLQSLHVRKSFEITNVKPSQVRIVVGRPRSLCRAYEYDRCERSHHGAIPANGKVILSRDNAVVIVPT